MDFLHTYIYFILLSFIASLFLYRKRPLDLYLRIFPGFLLFTLVAESYCAWLSWLDRNNTLHYNLFSTFEFCFYLFVIHCIIQRPRVKKIVLIVILVYPAVAVLNILLIHRANSFHTTTYSVGCLLIVGFCIYYFWELFQRPRPEPLQYNPAFWICTGLLFFYCCGFPLYGLVNLWKSSWKLMLKNFTLITEILNIFLYSLFTIAFICARTRKYTLSPS